MVVRWVVACFRAVASADLAEDGGVGCAGGRRPKREREDSSIGWKSIRARRPP